MVTLSMRLKVRHDLKNHSMPNGEPIDNQTTTKEMSILSEIIKIGNHKREKSRHVLLHFKPIVGAKPSMARN